MGIIFDHLQSSFDDLNVMHDFYLEGDVSEAEMQISFDECQKSWGRPEFKNMLSKEEDNLPAIVTINPGAEVPKAKIGLKCLCVCTSWAKKTNSRSKN